MGSQLSVKLFSSEANSSNHVGHESLSEVVENLRNKLPEDQHIDYGALRA